MKYIKSLLNKKKGRRVDEGALKRRKEYCKLELEKLSIPELENRYTGAIKDWKTFKKEAIDKYEEKLLQMYPVEIVGDNDIAKKRRRQAIKSIKQA